jgi:hypothetical protein
MTYQEYVLDVFAEDQSAMGLCGEEIQDIIDENSFSSIEKWLIKKGYDLDEMYNNDCA